MADLTVEQFEQVPDFLKADYVQEGEVYRHTGELKAAKLKSSLDNLDGKLKEFERNEQAKIEAARQAALEEAKTKGDVKAIEERYQQQMADLEKRTAEKVRDEVTKEFTQKQADTKAAGIADTIAASKAVDARAEKALQKLIAGRVKLNPDTGKEYFLDDNGSALSVDRAGFESMIAEEYPHLVKASVATTGGGKANGNNGGSAPNANSNAMADEAKKKGDVNAFLKATLNIKGT